MEPYENLDGHSGVTAYKTTPDSITVEFSNNAQYLYTYASTGKRTVEHMKALARSGRGLSTYISQSVREKFEKQLK